MARKPADTTAAATAVAEEAAPARAIPEKSLWWFGTLPASVLCDYQNSVRERDPVTKDFFRIEKEDPADKWTNDTDARVWTGKCRWYQSLAVKGFSFPAFTEIIERQATIETEVSATPFPGAVEVLKRDAVIAVLRACWRRAVRYKAGNGDIMSLRNFHKVEVVDFDQGLKPDDMSEAEWIQNRQRLPVAATPFDADTDVHIAEFVYLVPIEADLKSLRNERGELNIAECVTRLPHQRINRKFFHEPPLSVAEMYPEYKPK